MKLPRKLEEYVPQSGRAFALGLSLALLVLALTITAGWLAARFLIHQQVADRDAEALHATTLMEQLHAHESEFALQENDFQVGFDAAVLASELRGVLGIRFFDSQGRFVDSFPGTVQPRDIDEKALRAVQQLKPHSQLKKETLLSDVFIYLPEFATGRVARVPTLEVTVPLHRKGSQTLAGAAQFIVDGQSILQEYRRVDRHLGGLAMLAFLVGGTLLVAMLWPAFRRVYRLNRELSQRNYRLQRANQELALAARSSALGSVSAHLMHGLKNPLASLSQFVSTVRNGDATHNGEDLEDALAAARRMQSLVEHTLEVLADARGGPGYELSASELVESVKSRVSNLAAKKGAVLTVIGPDNAGAPVLSSQVANLASLILVNLLENAIQATPTGREVTFSWQQTDEALRFSVEDRGPGFPEHLLQSLFLPCKSTHESGSGLGLAISKQIADYLGAELELVRSSSEGCIFALQIPAAVLKGAEAPKV